MPDRERKKSCTKSLNGVELVNTPEVDGGVDGNGDVVVVAAPAAAPAAAEFDDDDEAEETSGGSASVVALALVGVLCLSNSVARSARRPCSCEVDGDNAGPGSQI